MFRLMPRLTSDGTEKVFRCKVALDSLCSSQPGPKTSVYLFHMYGLGSKKSGWPIYFSAILPQKPLLGYARELFDVSVRDKSPVHPSLERPVHNSLYQASSISSEEHLSTCPTLIAAYLSRPVVSHPITQMNNSSLKRKLWRALLKTAERGGKKGNKKERGRGRLKYEQII